jgi:hypothetical protein
LGVSKPEAGVSSVRNWVGFLDCEKGGTFFT